MSARPYAKLVAPLREAAAHAAWTQWAALGFGPLAAPAARAIVDPEALVLASLTLGEQKRRLDRVMRTWLGMGSRLLSTGRLANLMRDYPESLAPRVAEFAAEAARHGDARWTRLAERSRGFAEARAVSETRVSPLFRVPAALMLRMRLAFGVGIKADALTFLIGCAGARAGMREIARSIGYADRAVRKAVEDLVAARFVDAVATSPASYTVTRKNWLPLLGTDDNATPLWRAWHSLYVVVNELVIWAERADAEGPTAYVAGSRLRDTFERLTPHITRALPNEHPDWHKAPEEWLEGPQPWVDELTRFLRDVR